MNLIEKIKYSQNKNPNNQGILLDEKIDEYIQWNKENMIKGKSTDILDFQISVELRNLIEKMAVWYELRYPDYEITRLMSCGGQEITKVDDVMFNNNSYFNNLLDENPKIKFLNWSQFYNTQAFINSLPWQEKYRFQDKSYPSLIYITPATDNIYSKRMLLHLTKKGYVKLAEGFDVNSNFQITNEQLKGMHIKDVANLLKENNIPLSSDNELVTLINDMEKWIKQREGLLDAVMYRIIERGGNRIGPRRGFLFANEFKRSIDIPMKYAIDYSDPNLSTFINAYIKAGGSKDLICYEEYFSHPTKTKEIKTVSIKELIMPEKNNEAEIYTEEEKILYQRMVNVLANEVSKREKDTSKKLQRKKYIKKGIN